MSDKQKLEAAELPVVKPEEGRASLREAPESGYGTLLRNVAASIEATDPDAAQAVHRASVDVEEMAQKLVVLKRLAAAARNAAAAPDYDEEAIRDALWALAEAAR